MLELQRQIVINLSYFKIEKVDVAEDTEVDGRLAKQQAIQREITGRDLFRYVYTECTHYLEGSNNHSEEIFGLGRVMVKHVFSHYDKCYPITHFDHYFRHLYCILKFVNQNDWLDFDEQYKYTSMLRGTLSRYELVWLFYNGLSDSGYKKLKPLLEHYSILKNLRTDLLVLCKENKEKLFKNQIDNQRINDQKDYLFAICSHGGSGKYFIGVFYSQDEIQKVIDDVSRWERFCSENNISRNLW